MLIFKKFSKEMQETTITTIIIIIIIITQDCFETLLAEPLNMVAFIRKY